MPPPLPLPQQPDGMLLVDTHAHLYSSQFDADRDAMVDRMLEKGVSKVFLPNIDEDSIAPMLDLCSKWPGIFHPMMGLHPCHVGEDFEEVLGRMHSNLLSGDYCAVGEIGLDGFWDKSSLPRQEIAFRRQIHWANETGLPIVIHSRDTMDDCIRIVRDEKSDSLTGIFHCFTGTAEQAKAIIDLGFMLGVGGVYTFKSSPLKEALRDVPLESIVLETDAPYLAPVPHRGKRNESSYIPLIANMLAEDKGMPLETIAIITSRNAEKVFRISLS